MRPVFLSRWLAGCFAFAILLPVAAAAGEYSDNETLGTVLNKIGEELEEHPQDYLERSERAWMLLEHGMTGSPLAEDIDTLLSKPAWRGNGLRQAAWRLYLLGRYAEAEDRIRRNLDTGVVGPEQCRMLARIALDRHDTTAARAAYREGWRRLGQDEDFISLLKLSGQVGIVSDSLLRSGLRVHPNSPGVHAAVFQAYLNNATSAANAGRPTAAKEWRRRALAVADAAQSRLWPASVDWKLRDARALLASGKSERAEAMILRALDLLESDSRLGAGSRNAVLDRQEIFGLLDSARTTR